jgi:hypothetical protein
MPDQIQQKGRSAMIGLFVFLGLVFGASLCGCGFGFALSLRADSLFRSATRSFPVGYRMGRASDFGPERA